MTNQAKRSTNATRLKRAALLALPLVLAPSLTFAASTYERARVVDVDPIYKTVSYEVPVQQCHEARVRQHSRGYGRRSATSPILGAIIGGALGNAVGHGKRNKQVGAVIGAVLGGSIGADISRRNRPYHNDRVEYETREVCDTAYELRSEEQLTGYNVSYVYAGQTYSTRMRRDPGDSVRVRVHVSPVE